jgi:uncharacterized ParB-like nuclease family protein
LSSATRTSEPHWVNPAHIRFKISPHHDLGPTQPGNWDIERRYLLAEAVKHVSIRQRYDDGLRWEDTDLFRINYRRRFDEGGTVRGAATWEALVAQYYGRVDGLFASMRRDGFQIGHKTPLPVLLIGRRGQVFIGNQGNHRLAMAQVLGLKEFAGKVICRHPLSPQ